MDETATWLEDVVAAHERFGTDEFRAGDAAKVLVLERKRTKRDIARTLVAALRALRKWQEGSVRAPIETKHVFAQADKLPAAQEWPEPAVPQPPTDPALRGQG